MSTRRLVQHVTVCGSARRLGNGQEATGFYGLAEVGAKTRVMISLDCVSLSGCCNAATTIAEVSKLAPVVPTLSRRGAALARLQCSTLCDRPVSEERMGIHTPQVTHRLHSNLCRGYIFERTRGVICEAPTVIRLLRFAESYAIVGLAHSNSATQAASDAAIISIATVLMYEAHLFIPTGQSHHVSRAH